MCALSGPCLCYKLLHPSSHKTTQPIYNWHIHATPNASIHQLWFVLALCWWRCARPPSQAMSKARESKARVDAGFQVVCDLTCTQVMPTQQSEEHHKRHYQDVQCAQLVICPFFLITKTHLAQQGYQLAHPS